MKPILASALLLLLCECSLDIGSGELVVVFPEAPREWLECFGPPSWLIVWYDGEGRLRCRDGAAEGSRIACPSGLSSPVLAYPYWPGLGIPAGTVRPAGAIAPFDVSADGIALSWLGGVSALFYQELLRAEGSERTLPHRFDWPRFRELLESDSIAADAAADPWRVDWRMVAAKTRASGFDSRRIAPRAWTVLRIEAPGPGPWLASSPFRAGPSVDEMGELELRASDEPESLLSAAGVLRYSSDAWAWFPASRLDKLFPIR